MPEGKVAVDFDGCQYVSMPESLFVLEPEPVQTVACCAPLAARPLSVEQAELVAPMLKALADPVRLRLMSLVASSTGGEACVCDLLGRVALSQPTVSHHLKVLHEAGLLGRDKRGVWVYYQVQPAAMAALASLIAPLSNAT